uniref:Uncharacterized protein n=1 Tax=viral metagenome TaxID=1070528 RepID=A0A6M3XDI2_9ZZZZ
MATLTEGLIEDGLPVVRYHGLNTNKNIRVGGSASVDMSDSTGTFKTPSGVTTLNGNVTGAVSIISTAPTGSGVGYGTGAGGAVTQSTNRTTGVTINKLTGTITTNNTSLAAEAAAAFIVTNSTVAIGDVVVVSQQSGAIGAMTDVVVVAVATGSFTISVMNNNVAAGIAETGAILVNFAVIKAASA